MYLSTRRLLVGLVVLVSLFTLPRGPLSADPGINPQIPFSGVLRGVTGEPLSGAYDMVFRLYTTATGGFPVWEGTHSTLNGNPVIVNGGLFSVLLGSGNGNTLSVDFSEDTYYLGITVGSDTEMVPRERLGATPYAFNASLLDGLDATLFVRADKESTVNANSSGALLTLVQQGSGDIVNFDTSAGSALRVGADGTITFGSNAVTSNIYTTGVVNAFAFTSTADTMNTFAGPITLESGDDSYFGGAVRLSEGSGALFSHGGDGLRLFQDTGIYGTNDLVIGYEGAALAQGTVNILAPDTLSLRANTRSSSEYPQLSLLDTGEVRIENTSFGDLQDQRLTLDFGDGVYVPNGNLTVENGSMGASSLATGGIVNLVADAQGVILPEMSDGRLKTDVSTIDDALNIVLGMRGVRYTWRDTERFGGDTEVGFIAQELQEVLPEVVRENGVLLSVNTKNIVAVVVEALKELYGMVVADRERVDELEERVRELEAALGYEIEESQVTEDNEQGGVSEEDDVESKPDVPVDESTSPEDLSLGDESVDPGDATESQQIPESVLP